MRMVPLLGWQLHCHPRFANISRGDSTTVTPTVEPCPKSFLPLIVTSGDRIEFNHRNACPPYDRRSAWDTHYRQRAIHPGGLRKSYCRMIDKNRYERVGETGQGEVLVQLGGQENCKVLVPMLQGQLSQHIGH